MGGEFLELEEGEDVLGREDAEIGFELGFLDDLEEGFWGEEEEAEEGREGGEGGG